MSISSFHIVMCFTMQRWWRNLLTNWFVCQHNHHDIWCMLWYILWYRGYKTIVCLLQGPLCYFLTTRTLYLAKLWFYSNTCGGDMNFDKFLCYNISTTLHQYILVHWFMILINIISGINNGKFTPMQCTLFNQRSSFLTYICITQPLRVNSFPLVSHIWVSELYYWFR